MSPRWKAFILKPGGKEVRPVIAKGIHHIPDWAWWLVLFLFTLLFLLALPRPALGGLVLTG